MKRAMRILSTIFTTTFILIFLLTLYFAINSRNADGVRFGPYIFLHVLSGSMEPTIRTGSLMLIKEVAAFEQLATGDIVTYLPIVDRNALLTHRIISIDSNLQQFITRGDANETDDQHPVRFGQVAGRYVFAVPFLGALSSFLRTPPGIAAAVALYIFCIMAPKLLGREVDKKT